MEFSAGAGPDSTSISWDDSTGQAMIDGGRRPRPCQERRQRRRDRTPPSALWGKVCTIDFSVGGAVDACSGLG
ncbi:hypothetical protein [Streptosporangium sp. NPDC000396]|uniref:hypothetical protein n=1 Tax=Streptosporangium sp. NPDC000396 TaxID=3366185 RepID=UPI0036C0FF39